MKNAWLHFLPQPKFTMNFSENIIMRTILDVTKQKGRPLTWQIPGGGDGLQAANHDVAKMTQALVMI